MHISSYLAQQTPGVLAQVWTDGRQQQRLSLDELEDQLSVHAFNSQLPVLIFGSLEEAFIILILVLDEFGALFFLRWGINNCELLGKMTEFYLPGTQRSRTSKPL